MKQDEPISQSAVQRKTSGLSHQGNGLGEHREKCARYSLRFN